MEELFRCPFCNGRGSAGVVAVDLHALLQTVPTQGADRISEEIEWSSDEHRRIFVFNPDGVPNRPCPHIISFVLDAELTAAHLDRDFKRPVSHSLTWDHEWFDTNDPDQELEIFLWTEVDDGCGFRPTTCFEITPLALRCVASPDCELYVGGTIIVAADAPRFLEELRTGVACA